jgi:predicted GH43/DUF377 family glycosyl hydrolase
MKFGRDIVHRWEGNPIISIDHLEITSNNIYSAAAAKYKDEYLLLVTIENQEGKTAIYPARSENGFHFEVDKEPVLYSAQAGRQKIYEENGVREPRITDIEGNSYIIYIAVSQLGSLLCLAETRDFATIKKMGIISEPDTKGGALFPRKIKGKYARLERPGTGGSIWISFSNDLITWGESDVVIFPRPGFWDSHTVTCGPTPIEVEEGWLLIYNGIRMTSAGHITRLGAAILDKEKPWKVVARSNIPIISPREDYERVGDHNNFVHATGALLEDDGEMKIYYGAADNCLCAGTAHVSEIIKSCYESEKGY